MVKIAKIRAFRNGINKMYNIVIEMAKIENIKKCKKRY